MKRKLKEIEEKASKEEDNTEKTRLKYFNPLLVHVVAKSLTPVLGGKVGSDEEKLKYNVDQINIFERNEKGEIYFPARWFRAMLRGTAWIAKMSETVAMNRIKYIDGKVNMNGTKPKLHKMTISPMVSGKKCGRTANYEKLENIEIETEFVIPDEGVGKETFEKWVRYALRYEGTGAFRKGFGQFQVEKIDFKKL